MSNESLVEQAIREHWGERCPDYVDGCPCCDAWREYDLIRSSNCFRKELQKLLFGYALLFAAVWFGVKLLNIISWSLLT